jgi:polysaccharide pyruvyl transferase WcaK-like protein
LKKKKKKLKTVKISYWKEKNLRKEAQEHENWKKIISTIKDNRTTNSQIRSHFENKNNFSSCDKNTKTSFSFKPQNILSVCKRGWN